MGEVTIRNLGAKIIEECERECPQALHLISAPEKNAFYSTIIVPLIPCFLRLKSDLNLHHRSCALRKGGTECTC